MYFNMYKYIDNYVNTNHVTQFPYPLHLPPPSPYPSPTYSSDLVGAFICKAQNYCRKCYIYTVGYLSNWYYFLLPYYNSIVTTPVHWNSHSPLHTIKLVYCNNHPHKHKLIYTNNILLTNTLLNSNFSNLGGYPGNN